MPQRVWWCGVRGPTSSVPAKPAAPAGSDSEQQQPAATAATAASSGSQQRKGVAGGAALLGRQVTCERYRNVAACGGHTELGRHKSTCLTAKSSLFFIRKSMTLLCRMPLKIDVALSHNGVPAEAVARQLIGTPRTRFHYLR